MVALGFLVAASAGCMLPSLESGAYSQGDASQQKSNSDPGKADSQQSSDDPDEDAGGLADTGNGGNNGGEDTGSTPDTGNGGGGDDSGNGGAPQFSEIRTLIEDSCSGGACHSGGSGPGGFGFSTSGSDGDFKAALDPIVTPGDASGSTIVKAIKGELSSTEMPQGGWGGNAQEKEQKIIDWINSISSL